MSSTYPVHAYIALGSNLAGKLANPMEQVRQALRELAELPSTRLLAASSLYLSRAVGPEQPDYINAVACVQTTLAPLALLDQLQALELRHQRVKVQHWGPRTLDLDVLLYADEIIDLPRLQVPHPYLKVRNFVLYPLAAIAPDLVLPCGATLASLIQNCPSNGLTLAESWQ
jgi:2-amino-4-hydroxy-6-hydroxymethyldihydropteridine diphosphokinase